MKTPKEPKSTKPTIAWAYFAPDGYIQVRSIAPTRKIAREMVSSMESYTWKDYEEKGFVVRKIKWSAKVLK